MPPMLPSKLNPPGLMVVLTLMMWLSHFVFPVALWIREPFNLAGIVILTLSLLSAAGAVSILSRLDTTKDPYTPEQARLLVTSGVYRYTRNPMYLSLLLLITGQAVYAGSLTALIFPAVFFYTMTRFQIRREERALENKFGEEYLSYKLAVRRWI